MGTETVSVILASAFGDLVEGVHNITYTETVGGVESAHSDTLTITVDVTPLSAPSAAPDLQAASDDGASDTDNETTDQTPTFDLVCRGAGHTLVMFPGQIASENQYVGCLLYTSPSPRDLSTSRMPSSA